MSVSLCHLAHNTPPRPQNNLSNPPTPPSSLPPPPPPSVQQKMVNGVTRLKSWGSTPKDAASARDTEGVLRGVSQGRVGRLSSHSGGFRVLWWGLR